MKPRRRKNQDAQGSTIVLEEPSLPTIFSSDLLTPEEERELLATFWEMKTELVKLMIRHFPKLRAHRPAMEPWPMAQFIRDYCDVEQRTKLSLGPRSGLREQRNGGWMLVRRDDASPSIDVTGPEAACLEHRRAERGSEMLTMGGELVVQCRAGIGAPRDTPRQVRERVD